MVNNKYLILRVQKYNFFKCVQEKVELIFFSESKRLWLHYKFKSLQAKRIGITQITQKVYSVRTFRFGFYALRLLIHHAKITFSKVPFASNPLGANTDIRPFDRQSKTHSTEKPLIYLSI